MIIVQQSSKMGIGLYLTLCVNVCETPTPRQDGDSHFFLKGFISCLDHPDHLSTRFVCLVGGRGAK